MGSRKKNAPAWPHSEELHVPALQVAGTHAQVGTESRFVVLIWAPHVCGCLPAVGSFTETWSLKTFWSRWEPALPGRCFHHRSSLKIDLCSKTAWSSATSARVAAFTPSPRTRNTYRPAGTEPPSASSLTATTALRWTCGALAASSLRSWGDVCTDMELHSFLCTYVGLMIQADC